MQKRTRFDSAPVTLKRDDSGDITAFEGLGVVYYDAENKGTEYVLREGGDGRKRIVERIMPTAFDGQSGDVRCCFNHDNNHVLGRQSAGTLEVTYAQEGVRYSAKYNPDDPDHVSVAQKVARGDAAGSSFAFNIESETMMEDDEQITFEVNKVRMIELGPVTEPAYKATSAALRSVLEQREQQIAERAACAGNDAQKDKDYAKAKMWNLK